MGKHVNDVTAAIKFDQRIAAASAKREENGYSRELNLFGVKAYYDMTRGIPLEEQTFPSLPGVELDPRETTSFKEGIERGKRLEKVGNLEAEALKIEEFIAGLKTLRSR